jgi:ribosomal protein L6P/L9E
MNFNLLGKVGFIRGDLGSLIFKGNMYKYSYTLSEGVCHILFLTRKIRKLYKGHVMNLSRDLYFGFSKSLSMMGMGLKYELTIDGDLRVHLAFSHYIDFDFSDEIVFFRQKDKFLVMYSGSCVHLNDVYKRLIEISKLSKYKEKGIIDAVLPVRLRVRKEKRR